MNYTGDTVFLLCILTIFIYADCTYHVLEGSDVSIKLKDLPQNYDSIRWKKDSALIAEMKRGKVLRGSFNSNGSLLLKNVMRNNAGIYIADISDAGGTVTTMSVQLNVYAKVPKPTVNFTCDSNKVGCTCDVKTDENLKFLWIKNGLIMTEAKSQFKTEANTKIKCTVYNPVHSSTSEEVTVHCSNLNNLLFGFNWWVMVGILAGGGGLVLLLMVVLLTCACRSCKRQVKMQQDEEEFRLNNLRTSEPSGQPKSKKTARGQPAPPIPRDEVSINEMSEAPIKVESRPRNQRCVRPPPPPLDEDEQPPPLPQPRKQAHTKI